MNYFFKSIAFLSAITLSVPALGGCFAADSSKTASIPNVLTSPFTSNVTIQTDDTEAKAEISKTQDGIWTVLFSEPTSLSGIEMKFENSNVTASYKGLTFSVPESAVPIQSAMQNLICVSDNITYSSDINNTNNTATSSDAATEQNQNNSNNFTCVEKDGKYILEGTLDSGEFIFNFTENGSPETFEMRNYNLIVTFENFSVNNNTNNTETATVKSQ